jgi:tetratricopeptide (TPR) repeat protein
VAIMQPLAVGGYMDNHGHTLELLSLLDAVIDIVRGRGEESREELHLLISKRANAFAERGDWANALIAYQETYDTAPNSQRRAMALSIMGRILYSQSEFERGDALFSQGLALAQAQDDDFAWAFALQQRTAAAGNNGDYEKAKDYGSQAVAVARRFKEQAPSFWGYSLVNLGSAEMHLGNLSNAIEIHQEALAIGEQEANSRLKADALHALGLDLHAMGEYAEARDKLNQATKIYQAIGNTVKEAEVVVFLNRAEELGK